MLSYQWPKCTGVCSCMTLGLSVGGKQVEILECFWHFFHVEDNSRGLDTAEVANAFSESNLKTRLSYSMTVTLCCPQCFGDISLWNFFKIRIKLSLPNNIHPKTSYCCNTIKIGRRRVCLLFRILRNSSSTVH